MTGLVHPLIGTHAGLGELAILAFLWAFVELLGPTKSRIRRAKIASLLGAVFFVLSWVTGGTYYVTQYGELVKPVIKAGAEAWAHSIVMETKEHVFLMLPFLGVLQNVLLRRMDLNDPKSRRVILILTGWIVLFALSMVAMGYLISGAYRSALEIITTGAVLLLPLGLVVMLGYFLLARGTAKPRKNVHGGI